MCMGECVCVYEWVHGLGIRDDGCSLGAILYVLLNHSYTLIFTLCSTSLTHYTLTRGLSLEQAW